MEPPFLESNGSLLVTYRMAEAKWIKQADESNNVFYFNAVTNETRWEAPEGFVDDLGSEWINAFDTQGTLYYYNMVTGKSSWTPPSATSSLGASVSAFPEWVSVFDPQSGRFYFYNNVSQECSWEQPAGFVKPASSNSKDFMSPELRGAIKLQCMFRARKSREKIRKQRGQTSATKLTWTKIEDPQSGFPYYYNNKTGDCVWDMPSDYIVEEKEHDKPNEIETLSQEEPSDEPNAPGTETDFKTIDEVAEDVCEEMVDGIPRWVKVFDPASKGYYYFNNYTQECTWDCPLDYRSPDMSNVKSMMSPELRAALTVQCAWRGKKARLNLRKQRGDKSDGDGWEKILDPQSGQYYYYNHGNGDVTWDTPNESMDEKNTPDKMNEIAEQQVSMAVSGEKQNESDNTIDSIKEELSNTFEMPKSVDEESIAESKAALEKDLKNEESELTSSKIEEVPVEGHAAIASSVRIEKETESKLPEWVEVYDPGSKAYYYFNNYTQECMWDTPEGFAKPDLSILKSLMSPELKSALTVQCAWRKKIARRNLRAQRGANNESDEEWQTLVDPKSGLDYYYHSVTGEVTWDKPKELMTEEEKVKKHGLPEWIEVFDPSTKSYYFYNNMTHESRWDPPEGYTKLDMNLVKNMMSPELKAALVVQCAWRTKIAKRQLRQQRGEKGKEEGKLWQTIPDPKSGLDYYYHSVTGEVTWDKPKELMTEEEKVKKHDLPEWIEVFDPSTKSYYFYNNITQESRWDQPEGYTKLDMNLVKNMMSPELKAALVVQCAWRTKIARRQLRQQRGENGKEEGKIWQTIPDPKSGLDYYFNSKTGEVTWDKPKEFLTTESTSAVKDTEPEANPENDIAPEMMQLSKDSKGINNDFQNDSEEKSKIELNEALKSGSESDGAGVVSELEGENQIKKDVASELEGVNEVTDDVTSQSEEGREVTDDVTSQSEEGKEVTGDDTSQSEGAKEVTGEVTSQSEEEKEAADDVTSQSEEGKGIMDVVTSQSKEGKEVADDVTSQLEGKEDTDDVTSQLEEGKGVTDEGAIITQEISDTIPSLTSEVKSAETDASVAPAERIEDNSNIAEEDTIEIPESNDSQDIQEASHHHLTQDDETHVFDLTNQGPSTKDAVSSEIIIEEPTEYVDPYMEHRRERAELRESRAREAEEQRTMEEQAQLEQVQFRATYLRTLEMHRQEAMEVQKQARLKEKKEKMEAAEMARKQKLMLEEIGRAHV